MILNWLVWICAVLAVAFVAIPAIHHFFAARAYNAGFKDGLADYQLNYGGIAPDVAWYPKSYALGYRHGRGY